MASKTENIQNLAWANEVKKDIKCAMLILYEQADWTADGLLDFMRCFNDYCAAVETGPLAIIELTKNFENDVGYYLDSVKAEGTAVDQIIKTARAQSIKACALALYDAANWEASEIRKFIRTMWDYTSDYQSYSARCNQMLKDTGIDKRIHWKFGNYKKKKKKK